MVKEPLVKVFQSETHPNGKIDSPVYLIEDGSLYPTVAHKRGWSETPEYEMRSDGALYRTQFHPLGVGSEPDFQLLKGGVFYRTDHHPQGASQHPVYEIRD